MSDEIAGVCMLRDAVDILPFICGHYLRLGFDRLVFIDDASTDGTFEWLQRLSRGEPRLSVEQIHLELVDDPDAVTRAANRLIAEGAHTIFPFDVDEFWNIELRAIRAAAPDSSGIFVGNWVHFAQDRRCVSRSRWNLLRARRRAPNLYAVQLIPGSGRPFLCHTLNKVGFRSSQPVRLDRGKHALIEGPATVLARQLEVFHLPFRSLAALEDRARMAARIRRSYKPGQAWQSDDIANAAASGTLSRYWEANSSSPDGFLDSPDAKIMLVPDDRLRRMMIKALVYMAAHHPASLLR